MTYYARVIYPAGGAGTYAVPFSYLDEDHVSVLRDGVAYTGAVTWPSASTVTLTPDISGSHSVEIRRTTPTAPLVTFSGGPIASTDLNRTKLQALYLIEEALDLASIDEGRNLRMPMYVAIPAIDAASLGDLAGNYLAFSPDGTPFPSPSAIPSTTPVSSLAASFLALTTADAMKGLLDIPALIWVNVQEAPYNAVPGTDCTTAIQAADDAASAGLGVVYFPGDVDPYLVNSNAIFKGRASWLGAGGTNSTIKGMAQSFTNGIMVFGTGIGDLDIQGLAFDGSLMTSPTLRCCLSFQASSRFRVRDCQFLNFPDIAMSMDGCNHALVQSCYFSTTAKATQQQALQISISAGASKNIWVDGNIMLGAGIDGSGQWHKFTNNYIDGLKFGGGIVSEVDAFTFNWLIRGNVCINATGVDSNTTACLGIENWAPYSVITDNICGFNAGVGIDNGGINSTISNNYCFNNGQDNVGAGLVSSAGIRSRYFSAGVNGSHSVITNNRCWDSQVSKTQAYGYEDQTADLLNITFAGNNFNDNLTAPTRILGAGHDQRWPQMQIKLAATIGTVTSGGAATGTLSVPGAKVGDYVKLAWSGDLSGGGAVVLILTGTVTADNTVKWMAYNPSGSSISGGGAGTLSVACEKPINYAAY